MMHFRALIILISQSKFVSKNTKIHGFASDGHFVACLTADCVRLGYVRLGGVRLRQIAPEMTVCHEHYS